MEFIDTLYGRPSTIKTQKCLFQRWILPHLPKPEHLDWDRFTLNLVRYWQRSLSPRTIKSLLSLLGRYAQFVGTNLDTKKYLKITQRAEQQKPIKVLTKDEVRSLFVSIAYMKCQNDLNLLARLCYYAGLRRGEAFGLRWGDIDCINNVMTIQRSYDGPTKNGRSRQVPIAYSLLMALEYKFEMLDKKGDNCLEDNIISKQFDPNPPLKKACKMAQIPEITIHSLRHTFATLALDSGKSLKQVSEILGHSSVSITMDVYWANLKGKMDLDFV